jgi:hypothetical protein
MSKKSCPPLAPSEEKNDANNPSSSRGACQYACIQPMETSTFVLRNTWGINHIPLPPGSGMCSRFYNLFPSSAYLLNNCPVWRESFGTPSPYLYSDAESLSGIVL